MIHIIFPMAVIRAVWLSLSTSIDHHINPSRPQLLKQTLLVTDSKAASLLIFMLYLVRILPNVRGGSFGVDHNSGHPFHAARGVSADG